MTVRNGLETRWSRRWSIARACIASGLVALGCQSPPQPSAPPGCVEQGAWPAADEVARARAQAYSAPDPGAEYARRDREDYLESVCRDVNAYRAGAGLDPELADFDVRFPWTSFQWVDKRLDLTPDHNGSESWADHLGLAGYHDNSIKRRRRAVMNALTFGMAQDWYDARGLGSPPDPD